MNAKLIMLPNPILVDTTVKTIDFTKYQYQRYNTIFLGMDNMKPKGEVYEIIAGIPELPSIDFSGLTEEECKKIGWVDVWKLAKYEHSFNHKSVKEHHFTLGFHVGFETAQSLNEKKFSEEDLYGLLKLIGQKGYYVECDGTVYANAFNGGDVVDVVKEYSESLSKPKEYNVEVDTHRPTLYSDDGLDYQGDLEPKITNNTIKILKILN